jgi:dienelactone hydrolase
MNLTIDQNIEITIPINAHFLEGILNIPNHCQGMVIFAHGSGSGRYSKRNQSIANYFNEHKLATLLFDLLTPEEEMIDEYSREFRFNIPLLAERILIATHWLLQEPKTKSLPIGYFGASTGAAAALVAAAKMVGTVRAIVSRGGRPDLAGNALLLVQAPTLLIVGGNDYSVLGLNQTAMEKLCCEKALRIVNHASHLFEEPGTLEEAGRLAMDWYLKFLV